jgi:DNA-directed RNA polymerase subunit RPC12/RpoP
LRAKQIQKILFLTEQCRLMDFNALVFFMNFKRILHTTHFQRLKLTLIPLLVVDLILVPISLLGGSPSLWGIIFINFLVILILVLRFTLLFLWRLRCRTCGKGAAMDTGTNDHGYPVVQCRRCGRQWIL